MYYSRTHTISLTCIFWFLAAAAAENRKFFGNSWMPENGTLWSTLAETLLRLPFPLLAGSAGFGGQAIKWWVTKYTKYFVFCWQSESAATSTSAAMSAQINHPAVKRRQLGSKKAEKEASISMGSWPPRGDLPLFNHVMQSESLWILCRAPESRCKCMPNAPPIDSESV